MCTTYLVNSTGLTGATQDGSAYPGMELCDFAFIYTPPYTVPLSSRPPPLPLQINKYIYRTPSTSSWGTQVVRGDNGEVRTYPVVETVQLDNVCHTTLAPARISKEAEAAATAAARRAVESLWGAGVFGVELFLMRDGNVLLNEIAPRSVKGGRGLVLPTREESRM